MRHKALNLIKFSVGAGNFLKDAASLGTPDKRFGAAVILSDVDCQWQVCLVRKTVWEWITRHAETGRLPVAPK